MDHQHGPWIPLTAMGDALVFGAPARQRSPHGSAPRMIPLDDECSCSPAWLCFKKIENLTQ
jgi:hypothetical protein